MVYAFLLSTRILLCGYGTIHLSIHYWVDMIPLGCFQLEATSNKVAVDFCTQVLLWADVSLSHTWIQHMGGIARLRISVCLTLKPSIKMFSKVALPFCIPTHKYEFQLPNDVPTPDVIHLFHFNDCHRCEVRSVCGFELAFH